MVPHQLITEPRRRVDARPRRGTDDFSYEIHVRLAVPCTCGGGRLVVRTDRRDRLVGAVVHDAGCPLGELVAAQPSVMVTTGGGGRGRDGLSSPSPAQIGRAHV